MVSRSGIRIGMQGIGTAVEWLLEPGFGNGAHDAP